MQQQRPSKLPLVIGAVLIVATIARHRRYARMAAWHEGAGDAPGGYRRHGFGGHRHHGFGGRHRHLAARLADCAEKMAAARDVEYV